MGSTQTANEIVNLNVRCRTVSPERFPTLEIGARHQSAFVLRLIVRIPTFLVLSFVDVHTLGWDDPMAFGDQLLDLIRSQWHNCSKAFKLCPLLNAPVLQPFLHIGRRRVIVDTLQDLFAFFRIIYPSHETGKHGC